MRYDGPFITPRQSAVKRDLRFKPGKSSVFAHTKRLKMHAHSFGVTIEGFINLDVKDFYKLISYREEDTKRGSSFKIWFINNNGRYYRFHKIPINITMKMFKALRAIESQNDIELNRLFPKTNKQLLAASKREKSKLWRRCTVNKIRS